MAPPSVVPALSDTTLRERFEQLRKSFGVPFAVVDLGTGELNHVPAAWLPIDLDVALPVLEEIARRGRPAVVEDCAPLLVLAVPLLPDDDLPCSEVAVATFLTQAVADAEHLAAAAKAVRVELETLQHWALTQPIWPPHAVTQLSDSVCRRVSAEAENKKLRTQLTSVSQHLLQTFEELNLLHRINERLSLSMDDHQLLELAVEWLSEVLPAECLLACMFEASPTGIHQLPRQWIYTGECPLPIDELDQFLDRLGPDAKQSMVVLDQDETSSPTWYYSTVREVISVPIRTGNSVIGWLVAINHSPSARRQSNQFGTLETSLLSSVASMVGMHSGNVRLYNDQSTFFESVVRAFSSAIDAKDPYTCGHSERVARISVLIARQLKCSKEQLNSIYLAGLLHDIGKIGVDDHILRKPGELTLEEFEHIKQHPTLGYNILKGVRQLQHVLPVVLHHHEAWDGSGYPGGLVGEEIPWLARIVAVADSFDAMSSDRPYRAGMPAEKLNKIFHSARGQQWDARVIDAFFAVRDEIESVIHLDRKQLSLDVTEWNVIY
ncbi:HD-GYP domain-containing protein [Aeoliella mucimassa]|uniref:Cyclic di-GMP phosphodiesterase response regulator RpfG n=1 Tax=Aeoliella mucimassa TaxID=2527972 RepID=A0A518AGK5_9BACT|nr:HD-GYP domain-containing protein [Aeoliella mucimassa]QDU53861.1 Cyclic di-GMP phosphodiesterase response regulator RpfG [Aeoliella mucimassa]